MALRRFFLLTWWSPPALWVVTLVYLRSYDGWGSWAAAPLLLPSLFMSSLWGFVGAGLVVQTSRHLGRLDVKIVLAMLASGSAALYYLVRYLARSAG